MPTCRAGRWHKTQARADECVKHIQNKDFDNLSTMSREEHLTGSSSSRSSRSQRARTPTPPPTPPAVPGTPELPPLNDGINDEEGYAPPPEQAPVERIPETPPQPQHRIPQPSLNARVEDWINDVPTTPAPVSELPTHTTPPIRGRAPRTEDKTTEAPNEVAGQQATQRPYQPWYRHDNMNALWRMFLLAVPVALFLATAALKMAEKDAGKFP